MRESSSQSKYLVTGATGFIGRHLVEALTRHARPAVVTALVHVRRPPVEEHAFRRWQAMGVRLVECDLLRLPESGLRPPEFEVVYHLAGHTQTELPSDNNRVNSEGTRNLLRWLGKELRGKRLIHAGTLASVDNPSWGHPIDEDTPCSPKTAYGRTKLAGENCVRELHRELGYDYTVLRLCTIIGPGYRPTGMLGILPAMLARNALGTRLNWPGRVSFLSVQDLVRVFTALPDFPQTRNELYAVSNGENPSFDELLDVMATILGLPRDRLRLPDWLWRLSGAVVWRITGVPGIPHRVRSFCWRVSHLIYDGVCADGSKLNSRLGFRYQSFKSSLREIYGRPPVEDDQHERVVAAKEVAR
jgi:nucleoside-diphosphate-sugar epimerase